MSAERGAEGTRISRRNFLNRAAVGAGISMIGVGAVKTYELASEIEAPQCTRETTFYKSSPIFNKGNPSYSASSFKEPSLPYQWISVLVMIAGFPIAAIGSTQELLAWLDRKAAKKKTS